MRFSASITTEEDHATNEFVTSFESKQEIPIIPKLRKVSSTTGYEMDSAQCTVLVGPDFDTRTSVSSSKSNTSKFDKGKLTFPSIGMMLFRENKKEQNSEFHEGPEESKMQKQMKRQTKNHSLAKKREKDEIWKTMMNSKNVKTEGKIEKETSDSNEIVDKAEKEASSSEAMMNLSKGPSSTEVIRVRIEKDQYYYMVKQEKVLTTLEDLVLKSGKYMIPFLLTYCQKMKEFCENKIH